jgi:hypothetical protein
MHRYICGEIVRCFASGRLLMAPRVCVRDEYKKIKSMEEIAGGKIPYTVILGFFLAACGKMYSITMDPVTEVIKKIRTVALGQHTTLNHLHFSKADVTMYREKLLYFIKNGKQIEGRETSRASWVLDKDGAQVPIPPPDKIEKLDLDDVHEYLQHEEFLPIVQSLAVPRVWEGLALFYTTLYRGTLLLLQVHSFMWYYKLYFIFAFVSDWMQCKC